MRGIGFSTLMDPPTCGIGLESIEGCAWYIIVEACWFEPLLGKLRRQNEIPVCVKCYVFEHRESLLFISYQLSCGTLITPADNNVKSSNILLPFVLC